MSKRLVFRPVADSEFVESGAWYEDQSAGLGVEFLEHVQQVLDGITENPLRYPIVFKDTREGPVSKFPFAVYYRVKRDRVVIISVFHCSRDPAIWQSRN